MKSSNRFLLGFGIFVLVFVVIAVLISIISINDQVKLLPEDTAEGTVQRFLLAVKDQDYEKAYGFLSLQSEEVKGNPFDNWIRSAQSPGDMSSWKAGIVKSTVRDGNATVEVGIDVFRPNRPFSDPVNTNRITFLLQKEDGMWKIIQPVDLWWLY